MAFLFAIVLHLFDGFVTHTSCVASEDCDLRTEAQTRQGCARHQRESAACLFEILVLTLGFPIQRLLLKSQCSEHLIRIARS